MNKELAWHWQFFICVAPLTLLLTEVLKRLPNLSEQSEQNIFFAAFFVSLYLVMVLNLSISIAMFRETMNRQWNTRWFISLGLLYLYFVCVAGLSQTERFMFDTLHLAMHYVFYACLKIGYYYDFLTLALSNFVVFVLPCWILCARTYARPNREAKAYLDKSWRKIMFTWSLCYLGFFVLGISLGLHTKYWGHNHLDWLIQVPLQKRGLLTGPIGLYNYRMVGTVTGLIVLAAFLVIIFNYIFTATRILRRTASGWS